MRFNSTFINFLRQEFIQNETKEATKKIYIYISVNTISLRPFLTFNAWLCNCMVNLFLYAIILRASYMKRKTFETILRNFHAMPFYTQKLQLNLNYHKHKILGDIEQSWRHQDQTSLLMWRRDFPCICMYLCLCAFIVVCSTVHIIIILCIEPEQFSYDYPVCSFSRVLR